MRRKEKCPSCIHYEIVNTMWGKCWRNPPAHAQEQGVQVFNDRRACGEHRQYHDGPPLGIQVPEPVRDDIPQVVESLKVSEMKTTNASDVLQALWSEEEPEAEPMPVAPTRQLVRRSQQEQRT